LNAYNHAHHQSSMPDQQKRETPTKSRRPITSTNTSKPARKFVQQNKCPDTKPHHHHTGSNKAQHQTKLALTIGTLLSSQRTDAHCHWSSRPHAGQPDLHYPRIWASTNRLDLRAPVLVTMRKPRRLRFAEGDRRMVDPGPSSAAGCDLRPRCAVPIRAWAKVRTAGRCVKSAGQDCFPDTRWCPGPHATGRVGPRSSSSLDRGAAYRAMSIGPEMVSTITGGSVLDPSPPKSRLECWTYLAIRLPTAGCR